MPQHLLVVTNRNAGTAANDTVNRALNVLREEAWVEVRSTGTLDELSDALTDTGDRTIVVAGGDGSLHAVAQILHDRDELTGKTLALLPFGTGNDFSRTLGIPRSARRSARIVLDGHTQPTDLVVDDRGEVTVNLAHIGAGAVAGERGARWKHLLHEVSDVVGLGPVTVGPANLGPLGMEAARVGPASLGKFGYPLGALQTALAPPMIRVVIEVDGEVMVEPDDEVLMVAIGNGRTVGAGLTLAPEADPHDGLLDILIATPDGLLDQLEYVLRLKAGMHQAYASARIVRGTSITISGGPYDCNSDGELDGPVEDRTWTIVPGAYSMVVPRPV